MSTFADLGLSKTVLAAVESLGYSEPTPVQAQAIPLVLDRRDVIAAAKTGTGKTAAFSLPTLAMLEKAKRPKSPSMLVITPTRELAMQIAEVCSTIADKTSHRIATVVGGVAVNPQITRLAKGVDVLIATPGRLIDLMNQNAVNLENVTMLVLDEADRMLDMGFLPSVKRIVSATPEKRQTLLFSATVDKSIMDQVGSMLHDPALVQIAAKGETADTVDQFIAEIPHALKPALLIALLKSRGSRRVIVFARTRHRADAACRKLKRAGFAAEAIHSDRSQNQRKRALDNFAAGVTDILVATDVLARGIDVDEVSYVVNYDIPVQAEDYVHRIGRTGRAGAQGFAVTFVSPENKLELTSIEKFIKMKIPTMSVEGFNLEEAAEEAAARATRAAARKDPELAEAARELKKRTQKKKNARKQVAKPQNAPKDRSSRKCAGPSTEEGKSRDRKSAQKTSAGNPKSTSRKGKPTSKALEKEKRSNSQGAKSRSAQRSGADMRPGRSRRAAVAEQRRKGRRK